ncbi:hypothetical protein V8J36_07310 [Frigidibacter sp. MR17.14]|uniref:hypothetical protein n=1 Tax=Frigidibacter sp. MR17.14 TaxID=3126509 RepID=UPI003012A372
MSFARKLSLTAAVLACGSRKELCACFRGVNPATEFELERSFKWLQGRAQPRSRQIYEDWARLLGTTRPGVWLAGCSTEAFLDEICRQFSADPALLQAQARAFAPDAWTGNDLGPEDEAAQLSGSFLCYSRSWSPYHQDTLIRGVFSLTERRRGRLTATYTETLPRGALICEGEAHREGSVLHAAVAARGRAGHERLFFSLLVPGRPVNVLCGQMQGVIISGPEPQPSSARIIMLRIPPVELLPPPCYVPATPDALAANLDGFALPPIPRLHLAGELLAFLDRDRTRPVNQVTFRELTDLSMLLEGACAED